MYLGRSNNMLREMHLKRMEISVLHLLQRTSWRFLSCYKVIVACWTLCLGLHAHLTSISLLVVMALAVPSPIQRVMATRSRCNILAAGYLSKSKSY